MIQKANAHRRDFSFAVGDLVLVRLQPYRQSSVRQHKHHKLSKRYYGPYRVIERIGPVAYKLQLPSESRIHPVFHIAVLKPFRGSNNPPLSDLPSESLNNQPVDQPSAILERRTILIHGVPREQVLIQWKGAPPDEASWEDVDIITACYPNFHLEDKVILEGEGSDTPPISEEATPGPNHENEAAHEDPTEKKRKIRKPAWTQDYYCYR
ncbi:unnamed protein product [Trifolium pratense]|uniref:Uncharacterized protein n=1 Tax=Trifolium pratense TaxID=57577 RepID=A0ACB0M371_TRIPR|nr:unnamed protein product [Trifolium pratense]